jgi:hypothetical protein
MCRFTRALGASREASLGAAFVFVSSAAIVGCFSSGLIHYGAALCYLPLVLYLGVRLQEERSLARVAALALALGLQLMGGHPQASWLTGFGAAVFLVGRRPLRPAAARADRGGAGPRRSGRCRGGGGGAGRRDRAAAGRAPRPEQPRRRHAGLRRLVRHAVLRMGHPGGADEDAFQFLSNAQLYAGVIPLLAGLCGLTLVRDRNARALALLALAAAVIAAGSATPLFAVLYHGGAGLSTMRIPSRASVLIAAALAASAGLWLSQPRDGKRVVLIGGLALAAAVGFAALVARGSRRGGTGAGAGGAGDGAVVLLVLWPRRALGGGAVAGGHGRRPGPATAALKRQNRDDPERPARCGGASR